MCQSRGSRPIMTRLVFVTMGKALVSVRLCKERVNPVRSQCALATSYNRRSSHFAGSVLHLNDGVLVTIEYLIRNVGYIAKLI